MDLTTLREYFVCINLKQFCEKYGIGYKHFQEVMAGTANLGKDLSEKIQTAILDFHDDLMEYSETLMKKPKNKKQKIV